jgi:hypothetical protein
MRAMNAVQTASGLQMSRCNAKASSSGDGLPGGRQARRYLPVVEDVFEHLAVLSA